MLYIQGKIKGLDSVRRQFADIPQVIDKAEASGLNKLAAQAQTASNKAIREVYNIKAGDVKKSMKRIPAKASYGGRAARLFALLLVSGGRLNLYYFGVRPKEPAAQKGIPVKKRKGWPTAMMKRGFGRFKIRRDPATGNAPFVARMQSGHQGVFVRTGRISKKWTVRTINGREYAYYPETIRELRARSVAQMFEKHARESLTRLLEEKGPAVMRRELEYYLSKIKKP